MMRHLFASSLIAAGVDVRTVAEYLGHSDGGALVLKTYSHLMPDSEDRAAEGARRGSRGGGPGFRREAPEAAHGGVTGL